MLAVWLPWYLLQNHPKPVLNHCLPKEQQHSWHLFISCSPVCTETLITLISFTWELLPSLPLMGSGASLQLRPTPSVFGEATGEVCPSPVLSQLCLYLVMSPIHPGLWTSFTLWPWISLVTVNFPWWSLGCICLFLLILALQFSQKRYETGKFRQHLFCPWNRKIQATLILPINDK